MTCSGALKRRCLLGCAFHEYLATSMSCLFIVLDFTVALPKRIVCLFALRQLTAFHRVWLVFPQNAHLHVWAEEYANAYYIWTTQFPSVCFNSQLVMSNIFPAHTQTQRFWVEYTYILSRLCNFQRTNSEWSLPLSTQKDGVCTCGWLCQTAWRSLRGFSLRGSMIITELIGDHSF